MQFQHKLTNKSFQKCHALKESSGGNLGKPYFICIFLMLSIYWNQSFVSQVSSPITRLQSNLSKSLFQRMPEQPLVAQ